MGKLRTRHVYGGIGIGLLLATAGAPQTVLADGPKLPNAISPYDFGGGGKIGFLLYKLDPALVGRYNSGLVTSKLPPLTFDQGRGRISFYGQLNTAFTSVDNGNPNGSHNYLSTFGPSQNYLGTRIRYTVNPDLRIGARFAFAAAYNRSDFQTDFDNPAGCDSRDRDRTFCAYDANVFLGSRTFGRLTFGLGETAFAGIGNITLGGTAFATNSDSTARIGSHEVFNTGFRYGDIAPYIRGVERGAGLRYDSPSLAGFVVSGSVGEANHTAAPSDAENYWDVALRYAGEFGGFRIAAGAGYQSHERQGTDREQSTLSFGGSIMHVPSGLYTSGSITSVGRDAPFNPGVNETDRASAWYVQAGISKHFFGIGRTTLYGEFGGTNDGANAGAYFLKDSETTNRGVGIVQNIDAAAMALYLSYKSIDATVNNVEGRQIDVVTFGSRIKF